MQSIRQGLFAVAACGLLLILAGAAVVFSVERINELAENQEQIGEKLFGARQLFEIVISMESSQRGYLLTGDPSYLDPYRRDGARLPEITATFERLYQGDAAAAATVTELRDLARAKQEELSRTVALAQAGDRDAALQIVRGNSGNQIMSGFRETLLALVAQQRAVRTGFIADSSEILRRLYLLGAGVAVVIMVLVAVAVRALSASISRLDQAQKAEEHNAMHDPLTGLPNRRYLIEWLATALAGARRAGRELHVLYFDLDGFKEVNDRFGHEAGDRVLQVTAERLRTLLRASDFVARLGGDEFVAAVPDTGEPPALDAMVSRVEQALAVAPIPELADGEVTASVGQACFPRDGNTPALLLAAADRAMYDIKERRHAARAAARRRGNLTASAARP